MARSLNKAQLIGNLGKDPELKHFPNGDAYCNVSLATNESWQDKQTGEKRSRTEWHNLVFTRKLAEVVCQYLKKGSKAYIEGQLRTRKWEDKDGIDRYVTEIHVLDMQMLDGKQADDERPSSTDRQSATERAREPERSRQNDGFEDDDIPFD